jgi:hypothetical protein
MRWLFLKEMHLDVLYNISNLRSDLRRPGSASHRPLPLFWIEPPPSLVNLSVSQSITCLFGHIYHTTTCSQKGSPKIHHDAPRNACGMHIDARWVCHVLTLRSPNQVITLNNHHVFIMFHITCDIIVQTISPFMPSIIENMWSLLELTANNTDWICLTLLLTRTEHWSLTRVIYFPYPILSLTQGLTQSRHP